MMTIMASMPKINQGGGRGGGTGLGPHAAAQSWQEQGPEPSSRPSVQTKVLLFIGVKTDTEASIQRGEKKKLLNIISTNCSGNTVTRNRKLPENIGIIGNGVCPLLMLNMYSIQLVALHSLADLPHSSDRALTLLDGAWTSLQALYIAAKKITDSIVDGRGKRDCFLRVLPSSDPHRCTTECMTSCLERELVAFSKKHAARSESHKASSLCAKHQGLTWNVPLVKVSPM